MRSEAEGAVPDETQAESSSGGPSGSSGAGESGVPPAAPGPDGRATADDSGTASRPNAPESAEPPESSGPAETAEAEEMAGQSKKGKKQGSFWKELPVLIGVALVLALIIKAFAVQAFYIPSASMENTLKIGDRVLVNKIVYHIRDIERGDIVVFNGLDSWDPEVEVSEPGNPVSKVLRTIGTAFGVVPGEKDYIKRVIGVPGDHVKCCDSQGRVTVNGVPLNEKFYLYRDAATQRQNRPSNEAFDVTVQPGQLWVMGDHREVSYDSRQHRGDPGGGAIPENRVIGRAFVIVWPLNRIDTLPIPKTFQQPALTAAADLAPATPLALGLAGAVPLVWIPRRWRSRRRARAEGAEAPR